MRSSCASESELARIIAQQLHDWSVVQLARGERKGKYKPVFLQRENLLEVSGRSLDVAGIYSRLGEQCPQFAEGAFESGLNVSIALTIAQDLLPHDARIGITVGASCISSGRVEDGLHHFIRAAASANSAIVRSRALANAAAAFERLGGWTLAMEYSKRAIDEPVISRLAWHNYCSLRRAQWRIN